MTPVVPIPGRTASPPQPGETGRGQLASGRAVMAVGGFNGTDPSPTLAEFQAQVRSGRIRYFIGDGGMSGTSTGGSDAGARIADWVAANHTATTVDGVVVHDLGV